MTQGSRWFTYGRHLCARVSSVPSNDIWCGVLQALFFDGRLTATDNVNPDFCQLAQSYGFKTVHCDSQTDLPVPKLIVSIPVY